MFCWLAEADKILTLSNLFIRGCNIQNATDTCVLCHRDFETVDIYSSTAFTRKEFGLSSPKLLNLTLPNSLSKIWTAWLPSLHSQIRTLWDLIAKAIMWCIWLERNNRIFQSLASPSYSLMVKITNILLSWFSIAADSHQHSLSEASQKIKRSINFISVRVSNQTGDPDLNQALE